MSWLVTNLIAVFFLPPLNLLLLGACGLLLWHRRPAIARGLVTASLAMLWVLCTPWVSSSLLQLLEGPRTALDPGSQKADAIVVLGAGSYRDAPEYGADTVSGPSLVRLRYAARLQRETGKPVLVSGGNPEGGRLPEAQEMKAVLEHEFNATVEWTETESNNTLENARFSYRTLAPLGIKRIYLITHAWHMPRAMLAFRSAGFEVIPAPTAYTGTGAARALDFMPSAGALQDSRQFMHEAIGLLWYRLRT